LIPDELLTHLQMLTACLRQRARRVRIVAKNARYLRDVRPAVRPPFVRLVARISAAPTGRVSVKFRTGGSFEKIQILLKSGQNVVHFTWKPKCVLLLPTNSITIYALSLKSYQAVSSSFLLSVCLSTCLSTDPTGWIYVIFGMDLWMSLKSGKSIGHCTLRCCRRKQIAIKAAYCSEIVSGC